MTKISPLNVRSPQLLLEQLGITEPDELDLEAIAQACGATIVYQTLEGCDARLVGAGDRAIIAVDPRGAHVRQRFSAAHELGHWLYDRGTIAFACAEGQFMGEWTQASRERRANRFAAGLLLPRVMLKPRLRGRGIGFDLIRRLAQTFKTSLAATAIRVVECGSSPARVVCYQGGVKQWEVSHASVPPALEVRRSPPAWDAAERHSEGTAFGEGPAPFPAELWLDHPDAIFYTLYAERCPMDSGAELVLLSWRNEEQLAGAALQN
jgi:Zn-dependent peptidase ImmA (M78 family)